MHGYYDFTNGRIRNEWVQDNAEAQNTTQIILKDRQATLSPQGRTCFLFETTDEMFGMIRSQVCGVSLRSS